MIISRKQLATDNDPLPRDFDAGAHNEMQQEGIPDLKATMTLIGVIDTDGYTYRYNQLHGPIRCRLEQLDGVENVLLLTTAVDVRDTSRFTGIVGQTDSAASADSNKFEIIIVWEAPQNA